MKPWAVARMRGRVDLGGHRAEAGVVAGAEERHEGPEQQQHERLPRRGVGGHQRGGRQQVDHVAALPSDGVADEPERHIAEPHPDLHHDDDERHRPRREADPAGRGRQREKRRDPEVEAPPRKERAGVHQRQRDGQPARSGREKSSARPAAAVAVVVACRRSRHSAGSGDAAPDPDREERRQDADEEDRAPAPHGQHDQR